MTEYADIPKVNALHAEQQNVMSAVALLDAGGTLTSFVVSAAPAPPAPPVNPDDPAPAPPPVMMNFASVSTAGTPPSPAFIADVRAWLVQRSDDIAAELAALGVTDPPKAA